VEGALADPFVPSQPAQPSAANSPYGCDMICVLRMFTQCQGLGLLPTTVSDWATFETVARPVQYSSGSFV
jgi:hypothetical protein